MRSAGGAGVLAIAGPQSDVTAGEQSVDHLVRPLRVRGRIDAAAAGDADLPAGDLLAEGDGPARLAVIARGQ